MTLLTFRNFNNQSAVFSRQLAVGKEDNKHYHSIILSFIHFITKTIKIRLNKNYSICLSAFLITNLPYVLTENICYRQGLTCFKINHCIY